MKKTLALLALVISIVGIVAGIYLVQRQQSLKSKASAAVGASGSYNMGVLVIKYFPLTADGKNIDIKVTGDVGDSYSLIKQRTIDATNTLKTSLEKASTYLGYKDTTATPSLTYQIVDTKEYTQAVPIKAHGTRASYPDYNKVMQDHNICNYVNNQGVREVWIWAYQGPNRPAFGGTPSLGIDESKMSGPNGDISNSGRYNDMPVCQFTYRVYTFNYNSGAGNAMHSWGHQLESELAVVDANLFQIFQGPTHPGCDSANPGDIDGNGLINAIDSAQCTATRGNGIGRCGNVHNPPNSRQEYDWVNTTPNKSDCLNWNPDTISQVTDISCQIWGCTDLNYFIWMWQNLPGKNNTKTYQGKPLRNWWDVHGDFDNVIRNNKTFFAGAATQTAAPTSSPLSTSTPTSTPTSSPSSSAVYIRVANNAQDVINAQPQLFEPNPEANWTVPPQKLFESNSVIVNWNALSTNSPKIVYVQFKINNVWSATKTYTFVKNR